MTGRSKAMRPKFRLIMLAAFILVSVHLAHGEQPSKLIRLGFLAATSASAEKSRIEAFRQGMGELGYVEDKNIVIEWRFAEGKLDRLPDLAAELVLLKVDVIVTAGPNSTRAVKEATATIPIVMGLDTDPVGSGVVASLARPGGNITGLSSLQPELSGKRLELLKEIVPRLSRVAVFGTSVNPGNAQALRETEFAAGAFGVKLQYLDVLSTKDIETVFRSASKGRVDAVLLLASPVYISHRKQLADLAVKSRLQRYTTGRNMWRTAGLWLTALVLTICSGAPLSMWTRS